MTEPATIPCVGAIIVDDAGRLLLIKRGNEPGRGLWSVPGGRVEPGESPVAAVAREVREETGLTVIVGRLAGRVLRGRYDIRDYFAHVVTGSPVAGSDALDICWADPRDLDTTSELTETLLAWGVPLTARS